MSDILNVIKEIEKGKNLEINLPKYMNSMISSYYRNSSIRLAMNYYTYLVIEREEEKSPEWIKLTERLDNVIKDTLLSEFNANRLEEAVKEIDQIRNQVISNMRMVTLYADQFQIYEYILNRMEGRYEEVEALPLNYSDDKFIQKLSDYIMQDVDRTVISQKITEIVSTLPMRLTKQRYYEIIKNSFSLFIGSEQQALDDHAFMLKSCSSLLKPETGDLQYPEMDLFLKELKKVDYDSLTLEQYRDLKNRLYQVSAQIDRVSNLAILLIEVVNDVYVLLLSMPYALTDVEEVSICKEIMRRSQEITGEDEEEEEDLFDYFEQLEGKQERLSEQLMANSYLLDLLEEQRSLIESIMMDKIYDSLLRIEKLASTSYFIDLNGITNRAIVDQEYAEQKAREVIAEFASRFQESSRKEIRSVMAASMIALPVFFKNIDEFQEYAKISLNSCSDKEEKRCSVILLKDIMKSLPILE